MDHNSTITIPADDLPEVKDWKVGKTYKIEIEAEQMGINKERDYSDEYGPVSESKIDKKPKYRLMARFKIKNARAAKSQAIKNKIK